MDDMKILKYMEFIKRDMRDNAYGGGVEVAVMSPKHKHKPPSKARRADIFLESLSAEETEELRKIVAGHTSVEKCVRGNEFGKLLNIKNLSHNDRIEILRKVPQRKMLRRLGVYLDTMPMSVERRNLVNILRKKRGI